MSKKEKKEISKLYSKSLKANYELIKSINKVVYKFRKHKLNTISV